MTNESHDQNIREQVKSEIIKVCEDLSEATLSGHVQRFVVLTMDDKGGLSVVGRGGYISDYIGMMQVCMELLKRQATA